MTKVLVVPAWLKIADANSMDEWEIVRPQSDHIVAWNEDGERLHRTLSSIIYASRRNQAGGWEILFFGRHPKFLRKGGRPKFEGNLPLKVVTLKEKPLRAVALAYDGKRFYGASNAFVDPFVRIAFVAALPEGSELFDPVVLG
jgi:hypothetical protein